MKEKFYDQEIVKADAFKEISGKKRQPDDAKICPNWSKSAKTARKRFWSINFALCFTWHKNIITTIW